jgi:hypothetical protein
MRTALAGLVRTASGYKSTGPQRHEARDKRGDGGYGDAQVRFDEDMNA